MPAHGLKPAGTLGGLTKLEQMVCYLNLHLFEFLQRFQIGGIGPLLLPQILFFARIHYSSYHVLFFMFSLISFLILWIPCVPHPPYLIFIIQTHAYRQSMQCRVLKKKAA